MTETEFELLLENWVRWSKSRHRPGHVFSLEGNYRSRQPWDALLTSRGPIDKLAAQRTEDAWKAMPSLAHKLLLKWHYVYLRPVWGILKSLRVHGINLHPIDYDYEISKAKRMLRDALDISEKSEDYPHHNSDTGHRSLAICAGERVPESIPRAA